MLKHVRTIKHKWLCGCVLLCGSLNCHSTVCWNCVGTLLLVGDVGREGLNSSTAIFEWVGSDCDVSLRVRIMVYLGNVLVLSSIIK